MKILVSSELLMLLGSTKVAWKLSEALRSLSAGRKAKLFCFAAR